MNKAKIINEIEELQKAIRRTTDESQYTEVLFLERELGRYFESLGRLTFDILKGK
jgi:hypothetical protein